MTFILLSKLARSLKKYCFFIFFSFLLLPQDVYAQDDLNEHFLESWSILRKYDGGGLSLFVDLKTNAIGIGPNFLLLMSLRACHKSYRYPTACI